MTDLPCPEWETVSAAVDGELAEAARADALAHASACRMCSRLVELPAASVVAAPVIAVPATDAPAIDDASLTRAEQRWLSGRRGRWTLMCVGIAIVVFSVPQYVDHGSTSDHVARHLATWQIAFGLGLAIAAWFSRLTYALLAMSACFTVLTVVTKSIDLFSGHEGPWADPVHLVELVGAVLLWVLIPPHLRPGIRRRPPPSQPSTERHPSSGGGARLTLIADGEQQPEGRSR